MTVFGIVFLLSLLKPTSEVISAGIWAHYNDTLVLTSDKRYYTNADEIRYMCGEAGAFEWSDNKNGTIKGSCYSGAEMQLRSTNNIDTLFIITTGGVWTPYVRFICEVEAPKKTLHKFW